MASESVLQSLLERHREVDRVRYDVPASHAPMVLIALYRLGATDSDLENYYSNLQVNIPEPVSESPVIESENWPHHLGELSAASSYCRFFESEIERVGSEETLRTFLPRFMPGVAGHAFHPLLRVGYGVDLGDDMEIAFGLGYWAAAYLPNPEIPEDKVAIDPLELLRTLSEIPSLASLKPESRSIVGRIDSFYSHKDFQGALRPLRFGTNKPLEEISHILAEAFGDYHHFAMLHGVTSCHALRAVLPYCEDRQKVFTEYWYAVCATYLGVVNLCGDMDRPLSESDMPWSEIRRKAIETGIEHTLKFAYTAERESEEYGDEVYRRMAIREIEKPAPFF